MLKPKKWMGTPPHNCDFCHNALIKEEFWVDGKTKQGPFGHMCPGCFKKFGVGLGTGLGQKYDTKTKEKLEGKTSAKETGPMTTTFTERLSSRIAGAYGSGLNAQEQSILHEIFAEEDAPPQNPKPITKIDTPPTEKAGKDGPLANPQTPGAGNPQNWQVGVQTGLNEHQIRQKAQDLTSMIEDMQRMTPEIKDFWASLTAGNGRNLELNLPTIVRNLSREKLTFLAEVLTKLAQNASIT